MSDDTTRKKLIHAMDLAMKARRTGAHPAVIRRLIARMNHYGYTPEGQETLRELNERLEAKKREGPG